MSGRVLGNFILAFDLTFFVYFTIDILLRFIVSPIKLKWIKNVMNIVDLTSIVLFWLFFFISLGSDNHIFEYLRRLSESIRILLVYKITNLNWRLKTISKTFTSSYRELILALFFILLSLIVISTCMFYAEVRSNESFDSIPAVFWWTMVTMTTVKIFFNLKSLNIYNKFCCKFFRSAMEICIL